MPPVVTKRKREGIQLCKVYEPGKKTNPKAFFMEPKIDGVRGLIVIKDGVVTAQTSTGLPVYNVDHIKKIFEDMSHHAGVNNHTFDGEFLNPKIGFDATSGLTRKHDPDPLALGINFNCWDRLPTENFESKTCPFPLYMRKSALSLVMILINHSQVQLVEYVYGTTHEDIVRVGSEWVADGYEGIVIKDYFGLYEFRKSSAWLKWKIKAGSETETQLEGDFLITGCYEGKGKHVGRLGGINVIGYLQEDGNIAPEQVAEGDIVIITKAGTGFDDTQRQDLWDKFLQGGVIGQVVELRYDSLSKDGAIRFPVFYRLREDKD